MMKQNKQFFHAISIDFVFPCCGGGLSVGGVVVRPDWSGAVGRRRRLLLIGCSSSGGLALDLRGHSGLGLTLGRCLTLVAGELLLLDSLRRGGRVEVVLKVDTIYTLKQI